jgi:chromosomal replication initiator protein
MHGEEIARSSNAGIGAARAFEMVRRELLTEFGSDFFRSYIDPMRLVAEREQILLFRAGSSVAQERLRQQAQHRLEARLRAYLPELGGVSILLDREIPEDVRALADARLEEIQGRPAVPAPYGNGFTFENFCVDQSNFRAYTVAQMISGGAGMAFPVWLLHSPPGCGKTHLINAIAQDAAIKTPQRNVLIMTGQEFLELFQSSLQKRNSASFKDMVRAPDLLLIDDFQRICGKKATEEEAFHTIRNLTERGRQVVITADHNAHGLGGLDDRLRDTLKAATTCEIMEPDFELRRRILETRVQHYARLVPGFSVAPAALDMIADRLAVTGRELDGAVGQLVIEAKISGGEVSVEAAVNALQGKLSDAAERRITVQLVQKVTARYFNMTVQQLLERTRRQAIARPRQIAMYLATKLTRASLPDIGERFGGFDHTTIMYARDRVAELMETDLKMRHDVEAIARSARREP